MNPDRIRKADDIARLPILNPDGSGIASTLFALQEKKSKPEQFFGHGRRFWQALGRRGYDADLIDKISNYIPLVNSNLLSIEAEKDISDNLIRLYGKFSGEDSQQKIPLFQLSDGTVKWLALVVAVVTSGNAFLLEEPENYCHPKLQCEIVRIIRDLFQSSKEDRFALVSTHSETLLNDANPNEVVIVKMQKGATKATRPRNVKALKDSINESGFGLGYFYVTGALNA